MRVRDGLEAIPYSLIAIPLRFAVATVFWRSAMAHLANMQTTLYLFENTYHVPLLPPDFAAYLTVAIEVSAPILLIVGLLTRAISLVLILMVTVIEIFVFPQAWPTHVQWWAMLLVLLWRGAGTFSVDHWLRRLLLHRGL
ncbi:MAG TPA: DoxX family protein [Steroidobacteraceae bacterium]|nr:DoxX family protein [Steroidobacteraceae bacterium]